MQAKFLLDFAAGALLGGFAGLHVAGDQIQVFIGDVILP